MLTGVAVATSVFTLGVLSFSFRVLPFLMAWRAEHREIRMLEEWWTRSAAVNIEVRDRGQIH